MDLSRLLFLFHKAKIIIFGTFLLLAFTHQLDKPRRTFYHKFTGVCP